MTSSPFPRSPFETLYGDLFDSFNRFDAIMQQNPLGNGVWWRPSSWIEGASTDRRQESLETAPPSQQIQQHRFQAPQQSCNSQLTPWSNNMMQWPQLSGGWLSSNSCVPRVDFRDAGDKLVLHADMPGLDKSDVNVETGDGRISIHAKKCHQREQTEPNWFMQERCNSSFYRSFALPPNASQEGIKATYNNGVLEVNIPKTAAATASSRRNISVE